MISKEKELIKTYKVLIQNGVQIILQYPLQITRHLNILHVSHTKLEHKNRIYELFLINFRPILMKAIVDFAKKFIKIYTFSKTTWICRLICQILSLNLKTCLWNLSWLLMAQSIIRRNRTYYFIIIENSLIVHYK